MAQSLLSFGIAYNGPNDKQNIVYLSADKHYEAHILLVKIFESVDTNCYQKMLYAANFMSNRIKDATQYKWLKKQHSEYLSKKMTGQPSRAKGCKWSEESKSNKSKNHPAKGKTYEEYHGVEKARYLKNLRRDCALGHKVSDETREKLRYPKTDEHKKKISVAKKGKSQSAATKAKISSFMSDDTKNPHVDQTLYEFVHKITGEKISARKIDMKKKYGCSDIYTLFNGKRSSVKGWILIESK